MVKKELPPSGMLQAGPPSVVVLVTCLDPDGDANIITLGMYMPISFDPPMVTIGVAPTRYSHDLIADSGEFVVNVPSIDYEEESHLCGTVSGRDVDKFHETGFTMVQAEKVKTPLIKECFGHMECKVVQTHTCGDHTLFVGEVLRASLDEGVITDGKLDPLKAKPITQKNHIYFTLTDEK
jgi:flavin reductase (DIM6/NTAB) family NADH-FMN oxidoreductase RutF